MRRRMRTTRRRLIGMVAASLSLASVSKPAFAQEASPVAASSPPDLPLVEIALLTGDDPAAVNRTARDYGVYGTDLGSSFLYRDEIYIVFGDTFGSFNHDWRSNVLAISTDVDPTDGITFDRMIEDYPGHAGELIPATRIDYDEITVIPTYGVAVNDRLFLHYMSVEHWGAPGHWTLGSAGWAYSDDAGQTWVRDADTVFSGDTNWGQVAIVEHDGYLCLFGIPGGRYGSVKLARVAPDDLLEIDSYEYWDGSSWRADPERAAIIVDGPVGELSVRWNSHYRRWLMMYLIDDRGLIVLRSASELTGPWDDARVAVRATEYPSLYAPYMYPRWNDGPEVYFNLSLFGPYNVWLMQTSVPDLEP